MRALLLLCFAFAAVNPAFAEYVRAKPNGAAQAEAYCNMMARSSRRGIIAFGDQNFVGGAMLGNGIGNLIRQARTKQDCMTMMGYEWRKNPSTRRSTVNPNK